MSNWSPTKNIQFFQFFESVQFLFLFYFCRFDELHFLTKLFSRPFVARFKSRWVERNFVIFLKKFTKKRRKVKFQREEIFEIGSFDFCLVWIVGRLIFHQSCTSNSWNCDEMLSYLCSHPIEQTWFHFHLLKKYLSMAQR